MDQPDDHDRRRGRHAESPLQIPPRGWLDIGWRVYASIKHDRVLLTAAGVTFYLMLALVPTLAAFVSIYGLFTDRVGVLKHVALLEGIIPPGGIEVITYQLTRLTSESEGTLSITLLISLAIAFWSSGAGLRALFQSMNVAYKEREKRPFLLLALMALIFTFGGAFAALLVIATVVVVPNVLALLALEHTQDWLLTSYLTMLVVVLIGLLALYRWGPSRARARWRWIAPGALLALVALVLTSTVFSWYVATFGGNNLAYGSLGALIAFMSWMWFSVIIVIMGAEINSEIEHQTLRDSTTGAERPFGQRNAHMADTLGEVWPPARPRKPGEPHPFAPRHIFRRKR